MSSEKKFILDLPLKIFLTEDGTSIFLKQNRNFAKIPTIENTTEYGIKIGQFSPQSIQSMMSFGYISKIELSLSDFLSNHKDVIDLSKLIIYSMLYQQFDYDLFQMLLQSDCVKKYNRTHPLQQINADNHISDEKELSHTNDLIKKISNNILEPMWKDEMKNDIHSIENKNVTILKSEKFINHLSLLSWHSLSCIYDDENFNEVVAQIRTLLTRYMAKTLMADYISIMLVKLAVYGEDASIIHAAKNMYPGKKNIDPSTIDEDTRKKILRAINWKENMVTVSWQFGNISTSAGNRKKLHTSVYSKSADFEKIKEQVYSALQAKGEKVVPININDAWSYGEDADNLGISYLPFIADECKKMDIKFEPLVKELYSFDLTEIMLAFTF